MFIDSHCHVSNRWYEPLDTLIFQMDRCGVERAVLVQLLGGTDDRTMRDAAIAHPDRFAWVGAIDATADDAEAQIARAAEDGAAGLRMRAGWRSAEEDPLALWKQVQSCGLAVSLVGPASSFTDGKLAEIASGVPDLPLVLEHLGGLARPDVGDRDAALREVLALERYSNITLKLPGLGQLAPRRPSPDATEQPLDLTGVDDLLLQVITAFGADRLMWGSDFPPVAAREGYANALNWSRDFLAQRWQDIVEPVFGGTAAHVWFDR